MLFYHFCLRDELAWPRMFVVRRC